MPYMNDIIRLPQDLANTIKSARKSLKLKAIDIAKHSGRSRDVLHRLESGQDVTVSSLMDILAAMGLVLRLERVGLPTLQEMTERFANLDEDEDAAA
jgi:HTH-type transcriptional regulator/antitoxin HipB